MASKSPESIVFLEYYAKLVSTLAECIDEDLLPALVSANVITISDKNAIKRYGNRATDRSEYLLDNHVHRPLGAGITDNFIKLLETMQKIPHCKRLADEVFEEIGQTITDSGFAPDTPQDVPVSSKSQLKREASKQVKSGTNFYMKMT